MTFEIQYRDLVVKEDIPQLAAAMKKRIKSAIQEKLTSFPQNFGKPLRRSMKGYRKLRVGDYRVIFSIENTTVKILVIKHRSVVYKHAAKRIQN